jgi:DNA polymerase III, gamma/tau subunits
MQFSEIVGHQGIIQPLIRNVKEGRIAHAQLFHGHEGIGKLNLAIAYAQYICCTDRRENDSCGVCPSCTKFRKLAHPDLHFAFPIINTSKSSGSSVCDDFVNVFRNFCVEKQYFRYDDWMKEISGENNKQGVIYAAEGDEIIKKLSRKTFESDYKIMIIWLPEKMNDTAANKLLKILEEPFENTVFLLVSNTPDQLLSTILSRTQQIFIPNLTENEIFAALIENKKLELDEEKARYLARIANGSITTALSAIDENDESRQNFDRFVFVMRKAWEVGNKKDYNALRELRDWSEKIAKLTRVQQINFLKYAQYLLRENFVMHLQQPELNILTNYENDFSTRFYTFINEKNIEQFMIEFALAERHIEQNVNAKMVFFDIALKIIVLLKH